MLAAFTALAVVGARLIGPKQPAGARAGIFAVLVGFVLVLLLTRWASLWLEYEVYTHHIFGDSAVTTGLVLTSLVALALVALGVYLFLRPEAEKYLIQLEGQGWFSATAYKGLQGQRVRRGTILGILLLAGSGVYTMMNNGFLRRMPEQWSLNIPFTSPLVEFAQQQFLAPALAYGLALVAGATYLASRLAGRARRSASGLSTTPTVVLSVRAVALATLLAIVVFVLGQDRGVPYMFVLFVLLVVVMDLAIRRTGWGRDVMAVGGNVEAARRAGINVRRIYLSVFALCSTFAALGGILAAGRLAAVNQSSGGGDTNLNAIAAVVIGGTSLFGGRGSAYSALLGIIVIQSISSGLSLLNLDSSIRFMVTGAVLLLAVTIDSLSRRSRAAHGRA